MKKLNVSETNAIVGGACVVKYEYVTTMNPSNGQSVKECQGIYKCTGKYGTQQPYGYGTPAPDEACSANPSKIFY